MLSFYLPEDRRQALLEGRLLPERMTGSVLLADLSGFTRLTEKLVARYGDRRGPEELLVHLNRVYDAIVAPLHEKGGSVVYFSGDSITCFLEGDDGSMAAHVGLAMQKAMRDVVERFADELFGVGLKVAFGAGDVRRAEVGDAGIQLLEALSGRVVDEVAHIERLAKLGEVLVTDATRAKLGDALLCGETRRDETSAIAHVVGEVASRDFPSRAFDLERELPLELVRPRLLPQVASRLLGAHSEFIAELRKATALFVHFEGIDFEAPDGGRTTLDLFVRGVQEIADRYEGAVLSLTLGEKGSYLYLSFGALLLHPDDAERAVRAAEEILELVRRTPGLTSARIGISTGRVRAGSYGSRDRRVYGALGDDVNLAARLMMLSPALAITVSESVCAEARIKYDFEPVGEVPVKGKSSPVAIYRPVRKRGAGDRALETDDRKVLFGREKEKEALTNAVGDFSGGADRRVVLLGEAGIGKSQLLKHLLGELESRGIEALVGAGDSVERTNPYHAVSKLFRTLLGYDEAPAPLEERIAFFEAQLDADPLVRRRAPLLRAVLPFPWPDNEFTAGLEGEIRKTNTEELFIAILRRAFSRRATALVLEDVHWFDSASWEFIRRVTSEIVPHFIAVSARPHADAPDSILDDEERARFLGEDGILLPLTTLGEADISALLERRLAVESIPGPVLRLVVAQGGGHPFYSEELAYSLRDAGLLLVEGRNARLAPNADERLLDYRPGNVEAVITSRFDRLPPEVQTTLKVASVAGRDFDSRGVVAALPEPGDIESDLRRLEELSFLEDVGGGGYRFKHALTQKAIYETLLFSQRQTIHGKFAAFIEHEHESDIAPFHPLLGYHYECAGLAPKAAQHFEKAGERALRANANREALGFFRKALALSPSASSLVRGYYQRCIGDAQELLGNLRESQASSEEALGLLGLPTPRTMVARILGIYGQIIYRFLHSQVETLGVPESEEERFRLMEAARAHLRLSQVYYYTGQNFHMLLSGLSQLNLAARAGESKELAQAYSIMAAVASTVPLPSLSKRWGDAGYEVAERLADRPTKAFVQLRQSFHSLCVCDFDRACFELQSSADISKDLGDYRAVEMCYAMIGATNEIRGDFRASYDAWNAARLSGEERSAAQSIGFGEQGVGLARYRMEEGEDPLVVLERAEKILGQAGSTTHQYQVRGVLAEAYADKGDHERALHLASEAERLLGYARPTTFYILSGYAGVAHALLGVWNQDRGSQVLANRVKKAVGVLGAFSSVFSFGEGRAALYRGRLLAAQGKQRKAQALFRKGLAAAEARKTPYDEGLLRFELGRLEDGKPREELLRRAVSVLENKGAGRAAATVKRELGIA